MLIENLKFKVLFLHFLMNFDQFFFRFNHNPGGIILKAEMGFEPFWGALYSRGVILEGGYIRGFTVVMTAFDQNQIVLKWQFH